MSNLGSGLLSIVLVLLSFVACVQVDADQALPSITAANLGTEIVFPSPARSVTNTPTLLLSRTPSATSLPTPGPTATPSPPPTWTPLPTLSTEQAKSLVGDLFETNGGCQLPCWWGLTPGETTWQEASQFLAQFTEVTSQVSPEDPSLRVAFVGYFEPDQYYVTPLDYIRQVEHIYSIRNGVIESIEVTVGFAPAYPLSAFLEQHGPPTEIWMSTYSTEFPAGVLPFLVVLFYQDQGILAVYGPAESSIVGDAVRACNMEHPPSKLGLWSSQLGLTYQEAAELFGLSPLDGVLFLSIEAATSMDRYEFYETYREPRADDCFETPSELWPEQF